MVVLLLIAITYWNEAGTTLSVQVTVPYSTICFCSTQKMHRPGGSERNAPRGDQALPCPQLQHRHESPDTGEQEEVVIHLHAPLRIDRHPGHSRWSLDGAPLELAWINECEILHLFLIPLTSLVKLSWYSGVKSKGVIVTNSSFYARSIAHGQGKFFLLPVWCKQHTSLYAIPR